MFRDDYVTLLPSSVTRATLIVAGAVIVLDVEIIGCVQNHSYQVKGYDCQYLCQLEISWCFTLINSSTMLARGLPCHWASSLSLALVPSVIKIDNCTRFP